ncbi:TfoX/Sxy family protein [Anaerostipes sp.]|uniref:TfoX/Sxy family protein n=1 Tax=Anaerostipes sp. TaxID=1872530 RepID=UPI0025B94E97|nr:TfoX/Sxy family protein [Anaerostipes sp.]MBS7009459.1 TfoX/Sxy family protein [Anaerostipes sp.]
MASSTEFTEYVCGQLETCGSVSCRKMFGEYGVYLDGKIIGVICGNQLFVKITDAGSKVLPDCPKEPPYEGAKAYFLIEELENTDLIREFLRATFEELPYPKPKIKKKK